MADYSDPAMQESQKVINSFAHDLRSHLTAIRGNLELFLLSESGDERVEKVVSAMEQLDHLSELLALSLDLAEASVGSLKLTYSEIDLNSSMKTMIDLYELLLSERNIQIQFSSVGTVNLLADAPRLHRAFAKLFDYETKYLPDSSALLIQLDIEGNSAILTLRSDRAWVTPGVRLGYAPELNDGAWAEPALGLSFIKAIVQAHQGSLTISDRGEAIRIALPVTLGSDSMG